MALIALFAPYVVAGVTGAVVASVYWQLSARRQEARLRREVLRQLTSGNYAPEAARAAVEPGQGTVAPGALLADRRVTLLLGCALTYGDPVPESVLAEALLDVSEIRQRDAFIEASEHRRTYAGMAEWASGTRARRHYRDVIARSIPVLRALTEVPWEHTATPSLRHQTLAQLGYALKDLRSRKYLPAAYAALTQAIELRNAAGERDDALYELNRAKVLVAWKPDDVLSILRDVDVVWADGEHANEVGDPETGPLAKWIDARRGTSAVRAWFHAHPAGVPQPPTADQLADLCPHGRIKGDCWECEAAKA